jgi:hypothetical protein
MMAWTYSQTDGKLYDPDGKLAGIGYSGNGSDLDNPKGQGDIGHGPIPQGLWTIGIFGEHPVLGPLSAPLVPIPGNDMDGRDGGFYIHGDNEAMNHSASDGCIILARTIRQAVAASQDRLLNVVAQYAP